MTTQGRKLTQTPTTERPAQRISGIMFVSIQTDAGTLEKTIRVDLSDEAPAVDCGLEATMRRLLRATTDAGMRLVTTKQDRLRSLPAGWAIVGG